MLPAKRIECFLQLYSKVWYGIVGFNVPLDTEKGILVNATIAVRF